MVRQHDIRAPYGAHKVTKRIGRGDGSGKGSYSTAGRKGQQSRSGRGHQRPGMEGNQLPFIMRIPSQHGFTNHFAKHYTIISLEQLNEHGKAGDKVTPEWLMAQGLIRNPKQPIKILGDGELTKKLDVTAHKFSKSAKEKIEERGGTTTEVTTANRSKNA
ncbi:MAG: 50S ribosomal protein L15 [Dehalococcoidia bacterium]|nr:50S ribosomal protein L15 [Dehalococcoidia bacterium]